jgi:O-antigen/teichoic acid export membrane protein
MNIRKRVINTAIVTIGGDGLSQAIRLLGNLVLTRLLVPEFFGLMAIINVMLMALGLFADIGIIPGIIRSKRGLDPIFMDTAWTMQVLRGFILWIMTLVISQPAAIFYEEPLLGHILPVIGLSFAVSGFNSMSVAKMYKELKMGKMVTMRLASQVVSLLSMVSIAYLFSNIWSLVIGSIVGALVQAVWSHRLDPEIRHHFRMDKSTFDELLNFGKWIILSTAMMFLATQSDRLILGKFFSMTLLGVYSIAYSFAELPKNLLEKLSSNIIFPLISMFADLPTEELRKRILDKRRLLLYPAALLIAILSGFGDLLIEGLYDYRYREAGWILPMLSLGMWPLILYGTIDQCLYVVDNPRYPALGNFSKFVYMVICLPLAYQLGGKFWAVLIVGLNDLPVYLIINYGLWKKKISGLFQDFCATIFLCVIIGIILLIRNFYDLGITGRAYY